MVQKQDGGQNGCLLGHVAVGWDHSSGYGPDHSNANHSKSEPRNVLNLNVQYSAPTVIGKHKAMKHYYA